ncbi:Hypothetical predicted protein [Mytilus galloprovincialis]|uniref:C1q domain-containing protein n=1 Tax=Mytilus galloprovincialis TaxID=29158 RepID=A0A8B6C3M3_MYTGA|nr:Hypothetical predicted protein [Mytilus galloprovincialis]
MVQRIIKLEKQVSALTDANKVLHDRVEQCDIRHKKDMSLLYGVIQNISEKDNIFDPAVSKAATLSFAESIVLKKQNKIQRRQVGGPRIAFYAHMANDETSPGRHHTFIFHNITTNIGNSYNKHTGIFTATAAGVYVFSVGVFPYSSAHIPVEIVKNSDVIGSMSTGSGAYNSFASSTIVVQLSIGDACYIRTSSSVTPSGSIYSRAEARTSFAGWFLF